MIEAGLAEETNIPDIMLETPRSKENGDYATNIAMQLTKIAKKPPRAIAEAIVENLDKESASIETIEIAGPGFINITLKKDYLQEVVKTVLEQGDKYGRSNSGNGEKIQVEFVSANPTGDLHLGHARGASAAEDLVVLGVGCDLPGHHAIAGTRLPPSRTVPLVPRNGV